MVQAGSVIRFRHRINIVDVARFDHGAFAYITEQSELTPLADRNFAICPTQEDIGLDADRSE